MPGPFATSALGILTAALVVPGIASGGQSANTAKAMPLSPSMTVRASIGASGPQYHMAKFE